MGISQEDFQLDLALVEETLPEYLRTGDIHPDNVALLFPTTPGLQGGIHTEDNTYKAFKAFIDHPVLGKSLILASQKLGEDQKSNRKLRRTFGKSFEILCHSLTLSTKMMLLRFDWSSRSSSGKASYYDLDRVFEAFQESYSRVAEVMKPHFEAQDKTKWVHKIDFNDKAFHDLPQTTLR